MSNKQTILVMLILLGILMSINCGNHDYSSKSAIQKQTDSINENASSKSNDTVIVDDGSNLITNQILKNIKNLQVAYSDEIIASAKYKDFSRNAALEGFHKIALLYKAIALSESIHANNHKSVLIEDGAEVPIVKIDFIINNTKKNLENNIKNEATETATIYPNYIKTAELAKNKMAMVSFTYAMKTEVMHQIYFKIALEHLLNKTEKLLPKNIYVCPTCGNTFENSAPDRCEFSLTKADKFIKISSYK